MLAHVLDHFIFSSKLLTTKVKNIFFGVFAFLLLFSFWWFKGVAFGIDGPVAEHKGLQWRSVRFCALSFCLCGAVVLTVLFGCFF
jgi:dolichyl-phosphate-mannose-protein mannosyltransferase